MFRGLLERCCGMIQILGVRKSVEKFDCGCSLSPVRATLFPSFTGNLLERLYTMVVDVRKLEANFDLVHV